MSATERSIPRVQAVDARAFEHEIMKQSEPLIIEGALDDWAAFERWSVSSLCDRVGDAEVLMKCSATGVFPDYYADNRVGPLGLCLRAMFSETDWFGMLDGGHNRIAGWQPNPGLSPLADDVPMPSFLSGADGARTGLWVSRGGVRSRTHMDQGGEHNINVQVAGHKRVRLFSPGSLRAIAPNRASDPTVLGLRNFHYTSLPDDALAKLVEQPEVEAWTGDLRARDALFIPVFWFHDFEHLGHENINVNIWWQAEESRIHRTALRWALIRETMRVDEARKADALRALAVFEDIWLGASGEQAEQRN